uniref:Uncharacterized protein n=1 Tax=Leersia perrieri TaxID=77586 RepID=A0A0D9XMN5_9ORYZ
MSTLTTEAPNKKQVFSSPRNQKQAQRWPKSPKKRTQKNKKKRLTFLEQHLKEQGLVGKCKWCSKDSDATVVSIEMLATKGVPHARTLYKERKTLFWQL